MAESTAVFLAPCSNEVAQEHLHRTVVEGVPEDTYGEFTSANFGESVAIWGVKDGNEPVWRQLAAGDYIFFYTGDGEYTQVARVLATEHNADLAEELWPATETTWSYLIYLESPIQTTIDATEIQDFAGYERHYILGFQSLNDEGVAGLREAYGSVEAYVRAHSEQDSPPEPSEPDPKPETPEAEPPESPPGTALVSPEYVDKQRFTTLGRQLAANKQIVFYGPPGTGKTYTALNFARWWLQELGVTSDEQLRMVTFHPSFTYEDFLEGLSANATDNGVEYDIEPGVFKQLCDDARGARATRRDIEREAEALVELDPPFDVQGPPYVLIIDEINRGNLSQIFGETITLLEADKRGGVATNLAHSGERFTVPPNVYIIGTMNTADRSIALVDAALRRRFRSIDFPPDYNVVYSHFDLGGREGAEEIARSNGDPDRQLQALSVLAIESINQAIVDEPDLGKGKQIGHSYLLVDDTEDALVDAWRYELLPLLEEYFYGQFDRIRSLIFNDGGEELIDWEREAIRDFNAAELRIALQAIAGLGT